MEPDFSMQATPQKRDYKESLVEVLNSLREPSCKGHMSTAYIV